jgi:hypothetical protein
MRLFDVPRFPSTLSVPIGIFGRPDPAEFLQTLGFSEGMKAGFPGLSQAETCSCE